MVRCRREEFVHDFFQHIDLQPRGTWAEGTRQQALSPPMLGRSDGSLILAYPSCPTMNDPAGAPLTCSYPKASPFGGVPIRDEAWTKNLTNLNLEKETEAGQKPCHIQLHSVTFDHIRHPFYLGACANYIEISRATASATPTFSACTSSLYNIKGGNHLQKTLRPCRGVLEFYQGVAASNTWALRQANKR